MRVRLGSIVLVGATIGALLTACSQPNPNTLAGRSDIARQQCTLCVVQNPGDYNACHAICVQRVEDEEGYLKAIGR
jgi:hypothetical protein